LLSIRKISSIIYLFLSFLTLFFRSPFYLIAEKLELLRVYLIIVFLTIHTIVIGQSERTMLNIINEIRAEGCTCSGTKMKPVHALKWNESLELSATNYATYLRESKRFSHYSENGQDIGNRVDAVGYNWQHVGENIAEGQHNFTEVMEDWMESKTHCELIMNANMTEIGLGRSGVYWVQHFGARRD